MSSSLLKSIISFINGKNEVKGVFFNIICYIAYSIDKKLKFIYSMLVSTTFVVECCNRCFAAFKLVIVATWFLSRYQSRISKSLYHIEIFYDDFKRANAFYLATPIRLTYLISRFGNKAIVLTTFRNAETSS